MKKISVLITDDQKMFAQSLKIVLESYHDIFERILIAKDGIEMLEILSRDSFDIVILDVSMPNMDGIKAAQEIIKKERDNRKTKILMLSSFGYETYVRASLNFGADGYILKDSSPEELITAITDIFNGKKVVSKEISSYMNRHQASIQFGNPAAEDIFKELTKQERNVLSLLSKGYSNSEIAEKLFLAERTIRNYTSSIFDKLDVKDRFEALRLAIEHNIDLFC
ncbi:response regulator transcription factor [Treponema sp. OttesenSCG-928-L16]|nr:response regulator transcription factor [Treponema sp. OttesenSCG-928-L16]